MTAKYQLTIELTHDEYIALQEALRLAAGNRLPNDRQRLELQHLRTMLAQSAVQA